MSRTLAKRAAIAAVFILIAGYAAFQARGIVEGAEVVVISPAAESATTSLIIVVLGIATRTARITLDDNQIFTDPAGHFSEELALAPGTNVIKVEVEDRYKRQKTLFLRVYREKPAALQPPTFATSTAPAATSTWSR